MSSPKPFEAELLGPADQLLNTMTGSGAHPHQRRLEYLEAAAGRLGGFSLAQYRRLHPADFQVETRDATRAASAVLEQLARVPMHPALALSALARPSASEAERRKAGAYYTDFRLAQFLAQAASKHLVGRARVIDPASGTGGLLVAAVLEGCGSDRLLAAHWLRQQVFGADLSPDSVRGARLALSALTDDLDAIAALREHVCAQDSLLSGGSVWPAEGFDVVIANPPWEKLKVSRHEFLKTSGDARHYGAEYASPESSRELVAARNSLHAYSRELIKRYKQLGGGELDLYKAFVELFVALLRPGGCVSALVPAGLVRSQGTQQLREHIFELSSELGFTLLENRARFFAIDTRFKFVALTAVKAKGELRRSSVTISHARGTTEGVEIYGKATLGRQALRDLRPDLTVPEVKSNHEWRIYRELTSRGRPWNDLASDWSAEIVREVDMTRERGEFRREPRAGLLPLVEGRMIHQHRFGAKRWLSGTGRAARWEALPLGRSALAPQFWYPRESLSASVLERTRRPRVGFCDITGQTNERSLLAAMVPPGVVCGNKVPTLTFHRSGSAGLDRLFMWLAVANSFTFDWLLRRVITTTVNYFLLLSVPLPELELSALPARRLIAGASELSGVDQRVGFVDPWAVAEIRASLDVGVLRAYGGRLEHLKVMLRDFPLLDRAQPPIPGEPQSTITSDFLMWRAAAHLREPSREWRERVEAAKAHGAVPYISSEYVGESMQLEAVDG